MTKYAYLFGAGGLRMDDIAPVDIGNGQRLDASAFFSRELETIAAQTYDVEYPELRARTYMPINTDIDPADDVYTYEVYDMTGKAETRRTLSSGGPVVNVTGAEDSQVIRPVVAAYSYDFQEARASARYGKRLEARKAEAAKWQVEKEMDDVLLFGLPEYDLNGITSLPGVAATSAPARLSTLTPDAMANAFSDQINAIEIDTLDTYRCTRALMDTALHQLLAHTRMTDGSGTVLQFLRTTHPEVEFIKTRSMRNAAPAEANGSRTRTVFYASMNTVLEGLIPQEFEQFEPQIVDFTVKTNCHARHGGVIVRQPRAVRYRDNW